MSLLDAAGVVTGDIWCSGAFSFESPLKDLLDSGDYSLEQLLSEDELLQELRGLHPQLIEFFSTEKAVAGLARYATLPRQSAKSKIRSNTSDNSTTEEEDGEDAEQNGEKTQQENDAIHVRYPYMACEVICCEVKGIMDTLVEGFVPSEAGEGLQSAVSSEDTIEDNAEVTLEDSRRTTILDLLFSMLYDSGPGEIDDYRAGYFDKILSVLFRKKPQALSLYINEGGGRGQETLMRAMFKHLYSHSIMQIVQRLLLPLAPLPLQGDDDESNEMGQLYPDDAGDIDGLGSFRCNWSESPLALELLLQGLIEASPDPQIENDESLRLSLFQNASEVLITIIQNSPLTSPILKVLTNDPVLKSLTFTASTVEEGGTFVPHDSKLTCTMNVLESLILQLGGYGSVGTVIYPDDEVGADDDAGGERSDDDGQAPETDKQELATSETLISHLPEMLASLCKLLLCPDTENWRSPMQYSKDAPQMILGSSRLRIVRLLESLVLLGDPKVDSLLCESSCLEACLDLFWEFQWCSMLHQSVANLLVHVFEGANSRAELQNYFLVKCNLLGRLMNSFWEAGDNRPATEVESETRLSEAVMAMKDGDPQVPSSSVASERGSVNSKDDEAMPVSDDDVEAAMEQHEDKNEGDQPRDSNQNIDALAETVNGPSSNRSFRLGYMGHVIIICQALVHACTVEYEGPSVGGTSASEYRNSNGELGQFVDSQNEGNEVGALQEALERERAADSVVTDETPMNTLILAQLVDSHPLRNNWQDFVTTTLASETAIQSTPLGGFHGSPGGMDPLHSHRPGLEDDGDYSDEDGAAPPLPPRGLLVGGDVIDMDDNDLDVAASMMAGLGMGHAHGEDGAERSDGDLLASIPRQSGDSQPQQYLFDDPLGNSRFDDESDDSSSDEESELSGNTGGSAGALDEGVPGDNERGDVPVMNLFAGNLDGIPAGRDQDVHSGGWSDFANFDDAFAGRGGEEGEETGLEDPAESRDSAFDDVFGDIKADHSNLLEEDIKAESEEEEAVAVKVGIVNGEIE